MRCHQNCFGIWRVTEEAKLRKKRVFFKKHILKKIHTKSHYFLIFLDMHFVDTNTVILKKQKYPLKCDCMYRKNNPNGEFFSHFFTSL